MGVAAAKPKETSDGDTPVLEVDNTAFMEIADVDAIILKAAAATASAPMVRSNSPYSPQVYKRIVDNYLSLPAPPVLPSGLPNVWSLRVNAVKLNEKLINVKGPLPGRTPPSEEIKAEGWQMELVPFEMRAMQPFLDGPGTSLSTYGVGRPCCNLGDCKCQSDLVASHFTALGQFTLYSTFTTPEGKGSLDRVSPKLKTLLPPLGTFRPAVVTVHNEQAATHLAYGVVVSNGAEDYKRLGIRLVPLAKQSISSMDPTRIMSGYLVICRGHALPGAKFAGLLGVEHDGHHRLPHLSKCGGCGVTW